MMAADPDIAVESLKSQSASESVSNTAWFSDLFRFPPFAAFVQRNQKHDMRPAGRGSCLGRNDVRNDRR